MKIISRKYKILLLTMISVHLKIHVPDIIHKHKHIKTKYVHVYHPKVIHSEPDHLSYWQSRNDHNPNAGLINGGYPQPHLNVKNRQNELRISEDDFLKWQQSQLRKAAEKRRELQNSYKPDEDDDEPLNDYDENGEENQQDVNYEDDLYRKHKANKANSATLNKKEKKKHRNHNYTPEYESSNSEQVYAAPTRKSGKKNSRPVRPFQRLPDESSKNYETYGTSNTDAESTNVHQLYTNFDPTAVDPTYYSTLPKHAAPSTQDDIYSGLMSKKYSKNIADKTKLLADINYTRKQQTKNILQSRKGQ